MANSDEDRMLMAIEAGKQAQALGEVPVGACVFDETGNLLAVGHNRTITDSDPTAHAEIVALLSCFRVGQLSPDRHDRLHNDRAVCDVRGSFGQCPCSSTRLRGR